MAAKTGSRALLSINTSLFAVASISNFLFQTLAARNLGDLHYAHFSSLWGWLIFTSLFSLGLQNHVAVQAADENNQFSKNKKNSSQDYLVSSLLWLSAFSLLLFIIISVFLKHTSRNYFDSFIIVSSIPIFALTSITSGRLLGSAKKREYLGFGALLSASKVALLLLILLLTQSPEIILLAILLKQILISVYFYIRTLKYSPKSKGSIFQGESLRAVLASNIFWFAATTDVPLFESGHSELITSHYAAVNSLAKIPLIVMSTLFILDIPLFSSKRRDPLAFLKHLGKRVFDSLIVIGVFVGACFVGGTLLLNILFGHRFPLLRNLLIRESLSITGFILLCLVVFAFLPQLGIFELFILVVGSGVIWLFNYGHQRSMSLFMVSYCFIPLCLALFIGISSWLKISSKSRAPLELPS